MSLIREDKENHAFPCPWSERPTRAFATLSTCPGTAPGSVTKVHVADP
ncbi:MAG: hypothetical protein PVJ01_04745 [Pseudomonadota bacterium]